MKKDADSILIVEDEQDLRDGLRHNLELEGYRVETAANGPEGLELAKARDYSLILLDLMLPGLPGIEVLKRVREAGKRTPVIILSARGQDHDKVAGLELGADDYVTKPFGLAELAARLRAVLRRTRPEAAEDLEVYRFPDLTVDFKRYTVQRGGEEFQLSAYEAGILRLLIQRRGEVVTRGDLLSKVWGYVHLPTTRTVDNHIARLRKKVEENADRPVHVVTVHGIGYRFESEIVA